MQNQTIVGINKTDEYAKRLVLRATSEDTCGSEGGLAILIPKTISNRLKKQEIAISISINLKI